ncbi:hypothetical protein F5X99DRAFT_358961 [Biscogniauxia marginata]|nr:hypothetical protein F5X99DRAFT_358961 [Biscogniauxia marginata]
MPSTPLKMYQDPFEDGYFWDGGNAVPWGPNNYEAQPQVATGLIEDANYESLSLIATKQEQPMADIQALRIEELMSEADSGDETESVTAESTISSSQDGGDDIFPFLRLPFEIRQEIYRWLHLMSPVKQAQLMPWYPAPIHKAYVLKGIGERRQSEPLGLWDNPEALNLLGLLMGTPVTEADAPRAGLPPRTLLSPHRPFGRLPPALLTASRQIYHECRELPFEENEFVFANWFASGLWAARSAVEALRPWQARRMRWVRLELLARDIAGAAFAPEWEELCRWWGRGLQGLRLKIASAAGAAEEEEEGRGATPIAAVRDADGAPLGWVAGGLALLRGLRCLEVELVAAGWDDQAKIEWCRDLEEALNESRDSVDDDPVRVVCVERDELA